MKSESNLPNFDLLSLMDRSARNSDAYLSLHALGAARHHNTMFNFYKQELISRGVKLVWDQKGFATIVSKEKSNALV